MQSWPVPAVPAIDVDTPEAPSALTVHDTATGGLVTAGPAEGTATMYVCGITPYDATHLGHANTYLSFDLVNRVWRDLGLQVNYTQNITDVDDPLLERAARDGLDWRDLAASQVDLFREDMTALQVLPPDAYVGATETIDLVAGVIEKLQATGYVYQLDDPQYPDWYFDVSMDPTFMDVSGLSDDAALARFVEFGGDPDRAGKRNPMDCLVWMQARPGEPSWPSPLGTGRPGWHIECTAIALDTLGATFDVQAGGADLVFPHHEMCAAQGHALTGAPFARTYLHSGLVALDGEKMSKSKGNLELVSRLRRGGADPAAIRLAMLGHHWRENWEWTPDQLTAATERLAAWRAAASLAATLDVTALVTEVRRAMRTDLDAPAAIAAIDAWVGASLSIEGDDAEGAAVFTRLTDSLLGIKL
ncbi:cysteine--1-D-myo-inosityl 2-amino-2-deoxy-alpha-D-glucopyranoside ligase [Propionibacteriaceae bacterium G1746]|uniref:cysteine--1-D-myo-inosityl 2-amino-2-deoxy-alpha-D-glucopyranoside ligase n=1 Tax=Aestuariimicrobium sp. G57 TaxID=3418485 RepID=UPI003C23A4B3